MVETSHFSLETFRLTSSLGIDDPLAKHFSHLFIRDPLVIFSELKDQDDEHSMDHFEVRADVLEESSSTLTTALLEYTIDELANRPVQTSPNRISNRMASGIPTNGNSDDRFRERRLRGVCRSPHEGSLESKSQLLHADFQSR